MGQDKTGDAAGDSLEAVRWLSYAEGAVALGMKVESFRRIVLRKRWRRQPADDGTVRVAVPLDVLPRYGVGRLRDDTPGGGGDTIAALVAARRAAEQPARWVAVPPETSDARPRRFKSRPMALAWALAQAAREAVR